MVAEDAFCRKAGYFLGGDVVTVEVGDHDVGRILCPGLLEFVVILFPHSRVVGSTGCRQGPVDGRIAVVRVVAAATGIEQVVRAVIGIKGSRFADEEGFEGLPIELPACRRQPS